MTDSYTVSYEVAKELKEAGVEFLYSSIQWILFTDGETYLSTSVPPWVTLKEGYLENHRIPAPMLHDLMMTEEARDHRLYIKPGLGGDWVVMTGGSLQSGYSCPDLQSALDHIGHLIAEHKKGRTP